MSNFRKRLKTVGKEIQEWHGIIVTLSAILVLASASAAAFWRKVDGDATISVRVLLIAAIGLLLGVTVLVWSSLRKDGEIARLRKSAEGLEKEKTALLKPERRTTSGELLVDDILWSYTGDDQTSEWLRFFPLCRHCRTQLCVSDASDFFAIRPEDRRVRYRCDHEGCGKFDVTFNGVSSDREEKAARHINRKHEQKA